MSSNIPVQLPDNAYTNALPAGERKRLKEAVADFEAIFVRQMLGAMRKTVPDDGDKALIKKSNGEKVFQEMLDSEYADRVSRRPNGLGLKEMLYQKLTEGRKPLSSVGPAVVPGAPGSSASPSGARVAGVTDPNGKTDVSGAAGASSNAIADQVEILKANAGTQDAAAAAAAMAAKARLAR
ncbi:MAG: rod-binding protein [Magnetococcales bacterium]|nr:rod-binding protein [Magnetococcales bacterium]